MNDLPPGWILKTIGDVITPFRSIDPNREPDREFTYIDIGAIDNANQKIAAPRKLLGKEAPSRARRLVRAGDILFSTVRTYLKNIAIVSDDLDGAIASTGIAILRPSPAVNGRYLFHWVCSEPFIGGISKAQDGTMYPAIRDTDCKNRSKPAPDFG